jgi:hypothetical protein
MVIGGVVGYGVARAQQPYYTEQVQVVPQCSPWREIQQPDGTIVRERVCR